ncbi:porphobilinogen synthase [Cerasicoccus arenae]|uniref:Delta-aminolevulinic acid dehydratase n=1 Tax=Cerasicoccus arenae TaxID=424488 RepID=A0A8J3GE22_9BACT|nr:porphobilinogen synthase [Cerasicoccus arenae]MBK1857237.1 porphobilinogen synthase [Cerasicoccus arenae]GHC00190.1 delta-aminolevulinic acid dehydratase [Cerasicoccus arenae]
MSESEARLNLTYRPRRLRRTDAIRRLVRETVVRPSNLIHPLFVIDGNGEPEPIASMPGQSRLTIKGLIDECLALRDLGIPGVAIFPKLDSSLKTAEGGGALNPDTLVLRAVRSVKAAVPELAIITDVALDPYTNHGHDGVLTADGQDVANDETVAILCEMAKLNAEAGADFVAPSDMMDGRIGAIRVALDEAGLTDTAIMAYSAKFNSAYYGPFRDAVGSAQAAGTNLLGKQTYQCDPANRRAAIIETELDEAEGADVLMVKPAGAYLDIIRELRQRTSLPVAAYQVSGEYSQIHAAAQLGWLDYKRTRDESLLGIKRAGADMILTYFAKEIAAGK